MFYLSATRQVTVEQTVITCRVSALHIAVKYSTVDLQPISNVLRLSWVLSPLETMAYLKFQNENPKLS